VKTLEVQSPLPQILPVLKKTGFQRRSPFSRPVREQRIPESRIPIFVALQQVFA